MRDREHHVDCTITGCEQEADMIVNGEAFCSWHAQSASVKYDNEGVVYRKMSCGKHTWDAYGDWAHFDGLKIFVPEDPMVLKCPTCRKTAVDLNGHDPEQLS